MPTEAAKLIARITADLAELQAGMRQAGDIVDQGGKNLQNRAGRVGQNMGSSLTQSLLRSFQGGIGGLTRTLMSAIPAAGVVYGAFKTGEQVLELSKLGAQAEVTRESFEKLWGIDAERLLRPLREVSRGAVSDTNLLLAANRAQLLGVTSSITQLTDLMEIARIRGQAMGVDTTQAFDNIVTGIGRMSPLILDNLGIITDADRAYREYATSVGKVADELSDAEKRQALLNEVLSQSSSLIEGQDDTAESDIEKINALAAAWQNYKEAVGASLAEAPEGAKSAADMLNTLTDRMRESSDLLEMFNSLTRELNDLAAAGSITEEQFRLYSDAFGAVIATSSLGHTTAEEVRRSFMGVANALEQLAPLTSVQESRLRALDAAMDASVAHAQALEAAIHEVRLEMAAWNTTSTARAFHWGDGGEPKWSPVELRDQQEAAEAARKEYEWTIASDVERLQILEDQLKLVKEGGEEWHEIRTQIALVNQSLAMGSFAVRDITSEMQSAVSSAFEPSQVTSRDWWETNLGLYEDKPDEYLRRLRSAAQDADSEWKALLGGRTGDEAQLYVAQQEELWRSGQWDQLGPGFDPTQSQEAIINATIRQLEAERSRQAMIESIMRDPRLLGMGYSTAEISAVVQGPEAATGAEQAQLIVKGAEEIDVGRQLTETIDEQLRATSDTWISMGSLMITWISTGMEGSSPDIVDSLARLLFPYLADLQTQASTRP